MSGDSFVHLHLHTHYSTLDGAVQPAPAPRFGDGTPGAPIEALAPGEITRAGAHTREVVETVVTQLLRERELKPVTVSRLLHGCGHDGGG